MNINKIQAQLQRVPDQALIGYVQNPDGQVPSFLALAELTRRKEMRKSAAPQQPAPTQTVAQQAVAQAEPGIAQLPVPEDMFQEESYASGGIVAFAGGGSMPGLSEDDVAYQEALRKERVTPALGTLYDYTIGLPFNMIGKGVDYIKGRQPVYDPVQGKYVLQRDLPPVDTKAAEDAAFKAKMEAGRKTQEDYLKVNPQTVNPAAPPQVKPAILPYADPRVTADKNAAQIRADIASGKYTQPPPAAPKVGGAQRVAAPTGLTFTPGADLSGEYDTMMRPEVSAQEAMAKYQGLMGTDVARDRMKERLAGMEAKAAKDEERAPWMALAEAGLGMAAGKSQFALQNIAEGGTRGIKSYADAKERLAKAEERRFDLDSRIAQAERAEQVAAATYGLQSEEATKARNEANRMAKLGYKADRESSIAKGNFDAKKFNLEYAQKEKEIGLMDKRIDKQIAAAESQGSRYELQNKRESLKTIMNEVNDQLKTEQASMNPDVNKIAALQSKFNAAYNALYSLAIQGAGGPQPSGNRPSLDKFNLK